MKRVFVAFNISKGLWGKHLTEAKALKIAKVENGNEVLIKIIYGLLPKNILIDDLGALSYQAESYPKIDEYGGEYYEGEYYK